MITVNPSPAAGVDRAATLSLRVLSLGAGVQSTVLALMACEGMLPKPDAVIFADTGWEPRRVYEHLNRIEAHLRTKGIALVRVRSGSLRNDALDPAHRYASLPYFIRNADGSLGMGRRQCTSEYKLAPIGRMVRILLGATPPHYRRVRRGAHAEQWIGFSADEIGRVSTRGAVSYVTYRYPLIELGMTRRHCERWLQSRGWTSVAKSACIGCPYHGNAQWRELRDRFPDEWADAVAFDRAIRKGGARGVPLRGEAFLHRSRMPLDQAPIDHRTRSERRGDQLDLLDELGDADGCSPYGCRSGQPVDGVARGWAHQVMTRPSQAHRRGQE